MIDVARVLDAELSPFTHVELPRSHKIVDVQTVLRHETRWRGAAPSSLQLVPNKPFLQFEHRPTWAEFILLRLLEKDGWAGVWVKNFGGVDFWRDIGERAALPRQARDVFEKINRRVGNPRGGFWDIFAFRGDEFLFIESKQRGRDSLRPTQKMWLECALDLKIPISDFLIVEWLAPNP